MNPIIKTIADDLKIFPIIRESEGSFEARVIYSAIAQHIKAASNDSSIYEPITSEGASIVHTKRRCRNILEHCDKNNLHITNFATKGNEPFFHLVSEQLHIQSPTMTDRKDVERTPNEGRKVLLFSDSRQTAATLAKDLTKAADDEAIKKAIPIAARNLVEWCEDNDEKPSLS